jgi:hypothetical protein
MGDAMTRIREAEAALEQARADAKALVDRVRAGLGLAMIQAREAGEESQTTIAAQMGWRGSQQVRAYEQAYRDWADKHPGETPG